MDIIVSASVDLPIYEQIENQIKKQIFTGILKGNEALPSIRLLAKELKISVITIKRAYEDLEREGLIYTHMGKGSFVKPMDAEAIRKEHLEEFKRRAKILYDFAEETLIDEAEAMDILKNIFEDKGE